ncbi:hypothetical protein [Umezawaea beigongshangensis]|uniref:hypothetical protein n=1 Tax=Umezawaea beigongshangensis TaxID=2780383 RepID=UPI0018F23ED4|nr:hypothetical protein [Umezawaea beigongshangensis]
MTLTNSAPVTRQTEDAAPRARRGWNRVRGDFARAAVVVLVWQAAMTAVGAVVEPSLLLTTGIARMSGVDPTVLVHTYRWDGLWFHRIMSGEYATDAAVPAFYPLFPLSVRLVQLASFGTLPFLAAGLLLNTAATWLGVVALIKITRYFAVGPRMPWLAVALFLTSPAALFLHAFYSEATFIALGFWAYLFALRRQWIWMALCLIPLTSSRITAVLFVGLCFLEFCRSVNWKPRGLLSWKLLLFPASALGFAAFAIHLEIVSGRALGMTSAYEANPAWGYHVFNPNILNTVGRETWLVLRALTGNVPMSYGTVVDHLLPLVGLLLLLVASVYVLVALRWDGVPLAAFGLMSFVMFTLNSNLVSVHRYTLPCVVLYLALVIAVERRPALRPVVFGVMYCNIVVQTVLATMFFTGNWAG